jgi:hypothetical protein
MDSVPTSGRASQAVLSVRPINSPTRALSAPSLDDVKRNSSTVGSEQRKRSMSAHLSASTIIFGTASRSSRINSKLAGLDPGAKIAT